MNDTGASAAPTDRSPGAPPSRRTARGTSDGAAPGRTCCTPPRPSAWCSRRWAHRNLVEDAFIYLRVVKQLEAGHGPVFNIGQRVEAYTGTIWLFALTLADAVTPARLEWIAVTLGIACTGAGVLLAMLGARRLWSPDDGRPTPWFVPAGALVFVALLPVWVYASDGLENGLAYLWLGLCMLDPGPVGVGTRSRAADRRRGGARPRLAGATRARRVQRALPRAWCWCVSRRTAPACGSWSPCWRSRSCTRCSGWATSAASSPTPPSPRRVARRTGRGGGRTCVTSPGRTGCGCRRCS